MESKTHEVILAEVFYLMYECDEVPPDYPRERWERAQRIIAQFEARATSEGDRPTSAPPEAF